MKWTDVCRSQEVRNARFPQGPGHRVKVPPWGGTDVADAGRLNILEEEDRQLHGLVTDTIAGNTGQRGRGRNQRGARKQVGRVGLPAEPGPKRAPGTQEPPPPWIGGSPSGPQARP